jgi:hypothetical protein
MKSRKLPLLVNAAAATNIDRRLFVVIEQFYRK